MARYKYILIDADGTLFDYKKAELKSLNKTFSFYGITDENSVYSDLYKTINSQCWKDFESGKLSLDQLRFNRFNEFIIQGKLGDIDPSEMGKKYLGFLSLSGYLLDGALELLEKISLTHSVSMITNGITDTQYSRINVSGIGKYFDNIIISGEIGYQKPAEEYFEITMDRIGNPDKSEVIVIGDSLSSDIAGGNRSGIDTCWINFGSLSIEKNENGDIPHELKPVYEVNKLSQIIDILT
jgi:2-haloacid dehalogenase